ncbi:MAG: hypothetical protein O7I93_06390 [Gemmatimonadetes bacterium]|nr:hypothetical protein [Gemmatimonadota bacterium]
MTSPQPILAGASTPVPGLGVGWSKVADAVGKQVTPDDIARIWIFPPMRRDGREWGTAVVATNADEDRFTVFTAKYMLITRGRQRGQWKVEIVEVGAGPVEVVQDVVRGVQTRAGEGEPPIEIAPKLWFSPADDEPAAEA